ncbi:fluoride efflux transporter CrcB [Erythrobacter sp. JK5]|uniref:fluoride efflux transporter CrcB n=1 Tax=Erythrobacter sp. JK5 TaxID=2829500 RepID=UPI001BAC62FC|nr:fluoride efflux transporter CrcB [Erythrobacter sp. JK5]QUL36630.1 fluoride efflux transporter CrcB [Erythrobacter sp. JK5]
MSVTLSPLTASAFVATGGAIGALGRYQLGRAVMHYIGPANAFPWSTFAANLLGCFAMGLLFGWLARHGGANETLRLLLGVGLLGGFTTFSAFGLEMLLLIERGAIGLALAYSGGSVLAGVGALYIGLLLVRAVA